MRSYLSRISSYWTSWLHSSHHKEHSMQDSLTQKTGIIDPRVPLGKVYVDLTVDEVLEACRIYMMDKNFEKLLEETYNEQT